MERIAEALKIKQPRPAVKHVLAKSTKNFEAYQLFLKGRFLANAMNGKDAQNAIELLERAISLEPKFVAAHAELAYTYAVLNDYAGFPARECLPKAKAAALRALELDDSIPEAHVARATIAQQWEWDWPTVEAELKRALELDPNSIPTHLNLAWYLMPTGRTREAIEEVDRAVKNDPESAGAIATLAGMYYWHGQYQQAIERFKAAIAMEPRSAQFHNELAYAYERLGRWNDSVAARLQSMRLNGLMKDADLLEETYTKEGLKRFLEKDLELFLQRPRFRPDAAAQRCMRLGKTEEAIGWLEKTVEDRGFWSLMLMRDPLFKPLHSHPRFQALVERVGLPDHGGNAAR